jgi:heme/copper-type cytochrome/quinol oxidase subunit 1
MIFYFVTSLVIILSFLGQHYNSYLIFLDYTTLFLIGCSNDEIRFFFSKYKTAFYLFIIIVFGTIFFIKVFIIYYFYIKMLVDKEGYNLQKFYDSLTEDKKKKINEMMDFFLQLIKKLEEFVHRWRVIYGYNKLYYTIILPKFELLLHKIYKNRINWRLNFFFFFKFYLSNFYDFFIFFLKKYIYTINHKRIALNYLYFCFFSAMSGLFLATLIRIELSIPGSFFFKGDSTKYLQVITSHGLIMVFFVVTPFLFGFLGNFFIPYHVGSKDVAFPRLNSFGFWILFCGYIVLAKPASIRRQLYKYYDRMDLYYFFLSYKRNQKEKDIYIEESPITEMYNYRTITSNLNETLWYYFFNFDIYEKNKSTFVVQCNNSSLTMSGWTFITPFSSKIKYTGFGAQDIATLAVILAGVSTTISFVNLLITRRALSMPGLRNRKILMPFISINLFLTMRMLSMIVPVLGAAMIMLQLDRHFNFSFFDYSYGGDPVLFHHLFWFFGHPEVYVVIIPAFGIVSVVLPYFNFRRIAAKNHLIWATYIMAYMGFLVWGHHMYLIGLDHRSRAMYSTITVMISLPAIVKIVNWTLTIINGGFLIETPIIFTFIFVLFFLCGGLTGMWLSHVGLNIYVHDTFYIVAHFHFMFSASTFTAIFISFYYYFWQIFSVKYSEYLSYLHAAYWFFGQWLTFLPIFWIGYNGCPRRYHDYPIMYSGWNAMSSYGHTMTTVSVFIFFIVIYDSLLIKNNFTQFNLNIPRWHKRINYYNYKISYLQKNSATNFEVNEYSYTF